MLLAKLRKVSKMFKTPHVLCRKLAHRLPRGAMRRLLIPFPDRATIRRQLRELADRSEFLEIFLFPSPSCPWGYMFQRPQQLARALAELGYSVIYIVDTSFPHQPDWGVRGLQEIEPNLYLYQDDAEGEPLKELAEMGKQLVIWQYWPHQSDYIRRFHVEPPPKLIYDCIDHLTTFIAYPEIERDFEESIRRADVVLATATEIRSELERRRDDVLLVSNGVRVEDFQSFSYSEWPELNELRKRAGTLIGYYGAIAEWFDFAVVEELAQRNPDCTFLFVGEVYPGVERQVKRVSALPNVLFWPRIPYPRIPQLLAAFDVALLPFLLNDITLSTSPVKVYEYLAGGKLTVASDLPEIRGLEGVLIARDADSFDQRLQEAVRLAAEPGTAFWLKKVAEANTWQTKVALVLDRLQRKEEVVP